MAGEDAPSVFIPSVGIEMEKLSLEVKIAGSVAAGDEVIWCQVAAARTLAQSLPFENSSNAGQL